MVSAVEKQSEEAQKIPQDSSPKGVSVFSIKSVEVRDQAEQIRNNQSLNPEDLPKQAYTKSQFVEAWDSYIDKINQEGKRVQATTLKMTRPYIQDDVIHIEVISQASQTEILLHKEDILSFVRGRLQNYSIDLQVQVIEEIQEKQRYTFTSQDKYQRMLEQNPLLEELRRVLDLDF